MRWVRVDGGVLDHPKTRRAAHLLDVDPLTLAGHLMALWQWTADYADDGNLTPFDSLDVALAARWPGDPEKFIKALVDCGPGDGPGYLEQRGVYGPDDRIGDLVVHDWWEMNGRHIDKMKRDAERKRKDRRRRAEDDPPRPEDPPPLDVDGVRATSTDGPQDAPQDDPSDYAADGPTDAPGVRRAYVTDGRNEGSSSARGRDELRVQPDPPTKPLGDWSLTRTLIEWGMLRGHCKRPPDGDLKVGYRLALDLLDHNQPTSAAGMGLKWAAQARVLDDYVTLRRGLGLGDEGRAHCRSLIAEVGAKVLLERLVEAIDHGAGLTEEYRNPIKLLNYAMTIERNGRRGAA